MEKLKKFDYASKSYLVINKEESFNQSKYSCLHQGYEFANIDKKAMNFVKNNLLSFDLNNIKFFSQTNLSTSTPKCYTLLNKFISTVFIEEKCINNDYNFMSNTLCEKNNKQDNNTTSIYFYSTTQIVNTSSNQMLVIVLVIIVAALITVIVIVLCLLKRRRNNNSNEVILF